MTWDAQGLAGPLGNPLSKRQREQDERSDITWETQGLAGPLGNPLCQNQGRQGGEMENEQDRYYLGCPGTCGSPG